MTTKKLMKAIAMISIVLWVFIALGRTIGLKMHIRPDASIPGLFIHDVASAPPYCSRRPFVPKFLRKLLGLSWPGSYRCPDHPLDPYMERPD